MIKQCKKKNMGKGKSQTIPEWEKAFDAELYKFENVEWGAGKVKQWIRKYFNSLIKENALLKARLKELEHNI